MARLNEHLPFGCPTKSLTLELPISLNAAYPAAISTARVKLMNSSFLLMVTNAPRTFCATLADPRFFQLRFYKRCEPFLGLVLVIGKMKIAYCDAV
ncbi:hypothetical protein CES87_05790 [Pseudomonas sp. ERMR1:02]|nr:hypothetical protein CES87_05790 [Pseudomonas sp. ERMR1:02]